MCLRLKPRAMRSANDWEYIYVGMRAHGTHMICWAADEWNLNAMCGRPLQNHADDWEQATAVVVAEL